MTIAHCIAMVAPFVLICAGVATGQTKDVIESETAPPKLVMLVYQRFPFDKATESGKALAAAARACANLAVPNSWIVLESVTGDSEMLSFDPFDSFAHIGKAFARWGPFTLLTQSSENFKPRSMARWCASVRYSPRFGMSSAT